VDLSLPGWLNFVLAQYFPIFLALMAVEWLVARFGRDSPHKKIAADDAATSLSIYGLGELAGPLLGKLLQFSAIVVASTVTPLHLSPDQWHTWVLALIVTDLCYYWAHRADHTIRLLWTAHSVHHSSEYFNLTTALRLPWRLPIVDHLRDLAWVPAALIGIPPPLIFLFITLGLFYQFPLHTERIGKLPRPVEFIFNTPSHHRVHHGSDPEYLDKNFGGVFIIWDRMFGTFAKESHPATYGLTKNINTYNPIAANYHEVSAMVRDVRGARTWRSRFGHIFGKPGWQDKSLLTASAAPAQDRPGAPARN